MTNCLSSWWDFGVVATERELLRLAEICVRIKSPKERFSSQWSRCQMTKQLSRVNSSDFRVMSSVRNFCEGFRRCDSIYKLALIRLSASAMASLMFGKVLIKLNLKRPGAARIFIEKRVYSDVRLAAWGVVHFMAEFVVEMKLQNNFARWNGNKLDLLLSID